MTLSAPRPSRRRWQLVGLAALALALLAGWWWWRPHAPRAKAGGAPSMPTLHASATPRAEARLSGHVIDDAGRPVARAVVAIRVVSHRPGPAISTVVVADDRGAFAQALAGGSYQLRAAAPGLMQPAPTLVTLAASASSDVTLRLAATAGGVTGTVVDLESGVLAGARVEAVELGALDAAPLVALTDERGAYRLALAGGVYAITAHFDGYVDARRRIAVGARPRVENFRLAPGATLHGHVRRATDRSPIANACVQADVDGAASGFLPDVASPCVRSGADGSFTLEGLLPGIATLTAAAEGWGQAAPVEIPLGIGETRDGIELLLESGTTLVGQVVDQRDAAMAGVGVYVMRPDDAGRIAARTVAGDDGRFALEGLIAGRYIVRTVPDRARLTTTSAAVELPTAEPVVLRVSAGVTVTGRVTPPRAGRVHVRQPLDRLSLDGLATATAAQSLLSATIDETGRFVLPGVPAGTWELVASTDEGGGAVTIAVADRDLTDVAITLDQLASLCGVVREASGHALGPVTVTASLRSQPVSLPATAYRHLQHVAASVGTPVAEDGAFCVTDLTPGDYLMVVRDERQALMWSRRHLDASGNLAAVSLAAGERRTGWLLEVHRPLVTLRGQVVDEDGAPVADALVSVDRDGAVTGSAAVHFPLIEQMDAAPPVVSDATGAFALDVLPAPHRVTAEVTVRGMHGRAVAADPSRPVVVQVARTGQLRGTATGGSGVCRVAVRGVRTTTTVGAGSDCAFALDRLPAGRYVVEVRRGATSGEATVEVVAGREATCAVGLATLATVTLRIVDGAGAGQPGLLPILAGNDQGAAGSMVLETLAGTHPRTDRTGHVTLAAPVGDATLAVLTADGQRVILVQGVTISAPTTDLGDLTVRP